MELRAISQVETDDIFLPRFMKAKMNYRTWTERTLLKELYRLLFYGKVMSFYALKYELRKEYSYRDRRYRLLFKARKLECVFYST